MSKTPSQESTTLDLDKLSPEEVRSGSSTRKIVTSFGSSMRKFSDCDQWLFPY